MLLATTSLEDRLRVAPERKLAPVRVTGTAGPWTPLAGATALSVGAAVTTVNTAALDPPAVVTVTLRAPAVAVDEMVRVAVI